VKDLIETMAERHYDAWQRKILGRYNFSKTSLEPKKWSSLRPTERLELIEAMRLTIADQEIARALAERAEGL